MSTAARSIYLFSFYLMAMSAVLTATPNFLLELFGLPTTDEVWIRIVGLLAFVLGFYYFQSAKHDYKPFFKWTVYGRMGGFAAFCIMGFSGIGPPVLIVFGVVDLLAALWTLSCLKQKDTSS